MPPVTVISPEGEAFTVDETQAQDYIASGFRVETEGAGTTRVLGEERERAYGDSPVTAGALGVARGATFGLSDLALEGLGVEKETLRETRERNRAASLTGELIGDVGGALLSGGTGITGQLGRATLSGQLTRLGERAAGELVENRFARAAAGNALEGAIAAPAQYLAEQRLSENPNYSAEVLIAQSGRGLLLGGALGGGFSIAGEGLGALANRLDTGSSPTKLEQALDNLTTKEADDLAEGATTPPPAGAPKPKKQSVRSVIPLDERSKEAVLERAGEFSRAIGDQSTYARGVRKEIADLVPNLPPRQAAELQIAEQALRDATAAARRQFRDIGKAVNRGEMPALGEDMEAAVATLSKLDQARAALDERLLAARSPVGAAPVPTTPVPTAPTATVLPEGFERGPNVAAKAPIRAGMPGFDDVDPDAVYVLSARDLAGKVVDPMEGAGRQAARTESIAKGWAEGKKFSPIQATLKRDGTIEITDGRHRLDAAQAEGRDIAIRLDRSAADVKPPGEVQQQLDFGRERLAVFNRSEVEDGVRIDPQTGEVLDDPGWERLARDLEQIRKDRFADEQTKNFWAEMAAANRLGEVRREMLEGGGPRAGLPAQGIRPRGLDRKMTTRRAELGVTGDAGRPAISLSATRALDEGVAPTSIAGSYRAVGDEAIEDWARRWDVGKEDGVYKMRGLPEAAQHEFSTIQYQLRRLGRGEIDDATARAEIAALARGGGGAPPAPARAVEDVVDEVLVGGGDAPRVPAPAPEIPPPRMGDEVAPPAPFDKTKALGLISPGATPEKAASRWTQAGKLGADAAALLETAQTLGLGPTLIPEALSPVLRMYASYRAIRLAGARLGVLKQTEATKAAAAVTEARDRITKIARKAAQGGQRALGSQALQSAATRAAVRLTAPEARDEIRAVQELQQQPERLRSRVDAVLAAAPNPVIQAGTQVAARKLAYLAKVAPRSPWAGTPFADQWDPTPLEVDRWQETRAALERPLEILEALAEGNYSPESIDAIREVYPEVFGGFRRAVMDQIDEIVANAPYSTRVVLGDALEIPLDGTQLPFYEQGVQTASAALAVGGGDQQPRGASYIPAQSALAQGAQTAQQRRAMR